MTAHLAHQITCASHIAVSVVIATTLTVLMIIQSTAGGLGLPAHWPWILTAIQVVSLGLIGQSVSIGWLLGAAIQVSWIAYAALTDQPGFIIGCMLSAVIHVRSYLIRPPARAIGGQPVPFRRRAGRWLRTWSVPFGHDHAATQSHRDVRGRSFSRDQVPPQRLWFPTDIVRPGVFVAHPGANRDSAGSPSATATSTRRR